MDAVLSSNQRYVIIFGNLQRIKNQWKIRECKIPSPQYYDNIDTKILRTGGIDSNDEKLVIGFIRDCFNQKEFQNIQLPPSYLMKMISEKYNAETIHFIQNNIHWAIHLKDILAILHSTLCLKVCHCDIELLFG